MLYLSQILKSKVSDSSDKTIGRLKDILVASKPGEYAPLLYLVVAHKKGQDFFVPYEYVENLSKEEVSLRVRANNLAQIKPPEDVVYLNRDVLDQQIVDVDGARVVRVNDLRLGLFEDQMSVLGIDVSFKGLLRRLGVPGIDLFDVFKVNLIDWRSVQPIKGTLKLDTVGKNLTRLHPADLANIVEDLTVRRGSKLVGSLDPRSAAKVVEELDPNIQKIVINFLGPERAASIMEQMSTDEVVDLLKMMTEEEAEAFMSKLQITKSNKVQKLIHYANNTAGGLMTADFVTAKPEWTVARTTEEIKKHSPGMRSIIYIYIVNDEGVFQGAISMRRLLIAKPETVLKAMTKKLSRRSVLKVHQKINEVVKIMTKYNLFSAAVLDKNHKLMGVVTIDDVMRHLVPNA